jgi:predicted nucleic acid-binding protein
MKCLLDVNALVAFGLVNHEFHRRVTAWVAAQPIAAVATSSITELGFVRILSQAPAYGFTVTEASGLLVHIKKVLSSTLLSDDLDISRLPAWVKSPKQLTDGHLLELAKAHGAYLATLDKGIPGAYLIP